MRAALSWSLLLHLHLITCSFTIFFSAVFFLIHGLFVFLSGSAGKKIRAGKYLRRLSVSCVIGIVFLCASAWFLFPVASYGDFVVKQEVLSWRAYDHTFYVRPLSLFSIRDFLWVTADSDNSCRIQLGFIMFVSFIAFPLKCANRSSKFAWPLWITAAIILYFILSPSNLLVGSLKYIDIAQFTYRYIAQFQMIAVIMGVLALKRIAAENFTGPAPKKLLAFVVIVFALSLANPYLYPNGFYRGYPMPVAVESLYENQLMAYDTGNYLRICPETELAPPSPVVEAQKMDTANDRTFVAELDKNKSGALVFDVLYYPGLQTVEAEIDGRRFDPVVDTYWFSRKNVDKPFHALRLSGLPDEGLLSVRTRFVGSRPGNMISAVTLIVMAAGLLAASVKRRMA
jgi:hypothetical protein